jgi:hypothetical protein
MAFSKEEPAADKPESTVPAAAAAAPRKLANGVILGPDGKPYVPYLPTTPAMRRARVDEMDSNRLTPS